jgi:hypothetical protein
MNGKLVDTENFKDGDELNMADPQTLLDFVSRTFRQHPADHYGLIMWDHGMELTLAIRRTVRLCLTFQFWLVGMSWTGFGVDEDPGPHEYLNFKQILSALRTALDSAGIAKFDFLGFDACLMASMEMVAMLEPYANIYIASEDLEPGHGWNYQYFEQLYHRPFLTATDIATVLLDSFFNDGSDIPLTLSVVDLSKVSNFVAALDALGSVLAKELSTPGVLLGFVQAADSAYYMGSKDFVDLGHFLQLLKEKLPRENYAQTSYSEICAKIDRIISDKGAQRDLFVVEKHSDDVPNAQGLNIFLPKTDAKWIQKSKLYYLLWGYTNWHYLVGYVYGVRSGDITDNFLATDSLSWKNAIASVEAGAANISASRYLTEASMSNAVSAKLRYGVQVGVAPDDLTFWLGQAPATLDRPTGLVTAAWNYKVLTVSSATVSCAVYHELPNSPSESTMIFYVAYYRVGAAVKRAFGTYSAELGRWSLYSNESTGIAEIAKTESVAWIVPLVQDSDGRLVESTATDCKSGLMYTT